MGPSPRWGINVQAEAADTLDVVTEATSVDVGASTETIEMTKALRAARVLFWMGAVTLAVLTLASIAWIDTHADVWRVAARCGGSFEAPQIVRSAVSLSAAGALVGLSGSSFWLGVRPTDRRARRVFWSAVVVAWLAVSAMALVVGNTASECWLL